MFDNYSVISWIVFILFCFLAGCNIGREWEKYEEAKEINKRIKY